MTYDVVITPKAENELEDIYKFITTEYGYEQSAKDIISDIVNAMESLSEFPYRCRTSKYDKEYRILDVRGYKIGFKIEEQRVKIMTILPRMYY